MVGLHVGPKPWLTPFSYVNSRVNTVEQRPDNRNNTFTPVRFGWTAENPPAESDYRFVVTPADVSRTKGFLRLSNRFVDRFSRQLVGLSDRTPRFVELVINEPSMVAELTNPKVFQRFMYEAIHRVAQQTSFDFAKLMQVTKTPIKDVEFSYNYATLWHGAHRLHIDGHKSRPESTGVLLCVGYGQRRHVQGGQQVLVDMRQLRRDHPDRKQLPLGRLSAPQQALIDRYKLVIGPQDDQDKSLRILILNNLPFDGVMHTGTPVTYTKSAGEAVIKKMPDNWGWLGEKLIAEAPTPDPLHDPAFKPETPIREFHRTLVLLKDPKKAQRWDAYRGFFKTPKSEEY